MGLSVVRGEEAMEPPPLGTVSVFWALNGPMDTHHHPDQNLATRPGPCGSVHTQPSRKSCPHDCVFSAFGPVDMEASGVT